MPGRRPRDSGDTKPMSIFAAALQRAGRRLRDITIDAFFGSRHAGAPAAVAADALSGRIAPARRRARQTLFAFRAPLTLAPGRRGPCATRTAWRTGRAGRGARRASTAPPRPARREPARAGRTGSRAPTSAPGNAWVARELAWDAYLLRTRVGLRGGVRRPHDHAGRLLPVLARLQPRLPQLAALPAADHLHRAGAGARDPALLDQAPARGATTRSRTAPARCARASTSARRTTSTSGCCSPPPSTASARATATSSTSSCRSTTRSARSRAWEHIKLAYQPPGVEARAERRLHHGHDRRLVGLLHAARPDDRVDARRPPSSRYAYPQLAELAELRGDDEFAAQLRTPRARSCAGS